MFDYHQHLIYESWYKITNNTTMKQQRTIEQKLLI